MLYLMSLDLEYFGQYICKISCWLINNSWSYDMLKFVMVEILVVGLWYMYNYVMSNMEGVIVENYSLVDAYPVQSWN